MWKIKLRKNNMEETRDNYGVIMIVLDLNDNFGLSSDLHIYI